MTFALKYVGHKILDMPLETISSKSSSPLAKLVSAVAIAALSIISLGSYIVYAKNFFHERKVQNLKHELEAAINSGEATTVDQLFTKMPELKKFLNGNAGSTPLWLHMAAKNNDEAMVKVLIKHEAVIDADGRAGTPLACAVRAGHLYMVKSLVEKNANPNLGDGSSSPLFIAAESDHPSRYAIMKYLLVEKNASTSYNMGKNILARFATNRFKKEEEEQAKEVMGLLISHGALLNYSSNHFNVKPENLEFISNCYKTQSDKGNAVAKEQLEQIQKEAVNI